VPYASFVRGRSRTKRAGARGPSRGAKQLGARISADGYSESVEDVGIEHVLLALDRAERELVLEGEAMAAPAELRVAQA
jgi:hypothetical protein